MNALQYKISAAAAAVAYAVAGAGVVGHPVPDSHWGTRGAIVDGAGLAAFLLTAVALAGLAPMLAAGKVARWATRVAQAGLIGMAIESTASLVHGGNTLGALFFVSLLGTLAGLTTLAATGVRSGQLRWAAPLPALALVVGIAGGDHGGFAATGAVWLVLSAAHVLHRPAAAAA